MEIGLFELDVCLESCIEEQASSCLFFNGDIDLIKELLVCAKKQP